MRPPCLHLQEGPKMSASLISKPTGHPQQRRNSHSLANRTARRALLCILRIHIPIRGCRIPLFMDHLIREISQPRAHKRVRAWLQWVDNNCRLPLLRGHQQLTPVRGPNGLVIVYMQWLLDAGRYNNTTRTFIIHLARKSFGCANSASMKQFSGNPLEH